MSRSNKVKVILSLFILSLPLQFLSGMMFPKKATAQEKFSERHGRFFHLLLSDRAEGSLAYRYAPGQDEDGGKGSYDLQIFGARLELPLPVDENFYLRFGGEFGARVYDFQDFSGRKLKESSNNLYKTVLKGGAGWFIGEDLLLTGIAEVGGYSDYDDFFSEENLQVHGEAMVVIRVNPGAQLIVGVKESNDLEDSSLFPLVGLRLLSETGRFHLSITAPLEARIGYNLLPEFQLYAGGWLSGDEYRVTMSGESFDVYQQDRLLGVGLSYWLGNHWNFKCEAGVSISSKMKYKTNFANEFKGDLEPAPYVGAAISFAL